MVKITGHENLDKLAKQFANGGIKATRMAINDSLRWGRTQIRKDVQKEYNVKTSYLYHSGKGKGLKVHKASDNKLEGKIVAGHMPVGIHGFTGTRTSTQTTGYDLAYSSNVRTRKTRVLRKAIRRPVGMKVEMKKGRGRVIKRAFQIRKFGSLVFARGEYQGSGFKFRNQRQNSTGSDTPINTLNSTSVATMVLTNDVYKRWEQPMQEKYASELARQLKRLAK